MFNILHFEELHSWDDFARKLYVRCSAILPVSSENGDDKKKKIVVEELIFPSMCYVLPFFCHSIIKVYFFSKFFYHDC